MTGWLIAAERTRAVLVMQLGMNGVNILLDLRVVLGPGWGGRRRGALASLVAEWTGPGPGLWLCRAGLSGRGWHNLFGGDKLRRMLSVNGDIMLRSVLLQGSFTTFVFRGAGFGTVTRAANQVLMQFLEITAHARDGFAFAAKALVGQAIGAASLRDLRRSVVLACQGGAGGALVPGLAFWLAGPALIDLMTRAGAVEQAARLDLPWVAPAPVVGIASWMLDGIFIGTTQTRDMRNVMVVSVAVCLGALWLMVPWLGNHGLWAALRVLNVSRAMTLARLYPQMTARLSPV